LTQRSSLLPAKHFGVFLAFAHDLCDLGFDALEVRLGLLIEGDAVIPVAGCKEVDPAVVVEKDCLGNENLTTLLGLLFDSGVGEQVKNYVSELEDRQRVALAVQMHGPGVLDLEAVWLGDLGAADVAARCDGGLGGAGTLLVEQAAEVGACEHGHVLVVALGAFGLGARSHYIIN
jgi:hypothetical protein